MRRRGICQWEGWMELVDYRRRRRAAQRYRLQQQEKTRAHQTATSRLIGCRIIFLYCVSILLLPPGLPVSQATSAGSACTPSDALRRERDHRRTRTRPSTPDLRPIPIPIIIPTQSTHYSNDTSAPPNNNPTQIQTQVNTVRVRVQLAKMDLLSIL
jgi:hypothetical protein